SVLSFADALILMPNFGPSIKSLLTNKDKLYELSRTPLNKHCPAVFLKKLPKKLGDPGNDFLLEEVDAFLALEDNPTSPEVDQSYVDTEGDILILEAFLKDDPSLPPPNQENYLPEDLPTHHEYVFLEGDDKLPVIIAKDLSMEEKTALITVLKSYKRAIAWKLSYIKVVENEENELILTRLVTGWRLCIVYRKLNEATCKDHFPLPFMDQMLERLARNQYYCFLDGFSG
nr:transposon Ty3-I Gag-Pol polyprotein [Tanacetum cinerariifolium]